MRVISGSARGRMLDAVPGKNTRPTTDKVKESVFNILQFRLYDAAMLDLFAGTGQMGIEALSRGAARAVFVDQAPKALQRLAGQQFDVLFLDPPYGGELLNSALKAVESFDILSPDGIIICESSVEDSVKCPESFAVQKTYQYGTIFLTAMCRKEENS